MSDLLEPVRKVVTRWGCPHCSRTHSTSARTREHMGRCWQNPAVRSCRTCTNFMPDDSDPSAGSIQPEGCAVGVELPTGANGSTTLATHCPKWEDDQLRGQR